MRCNVTKPEDEFEHHVRVHGTKVFTSVEELGGVVPVIRVGVIDPRQDWRTSVMGFTLDVPAAQQLWRELGSALLTIKRKGQ